MFGTGLVDSKVITQFKTQNKPGLDYLDDMSDLSDSEDESPEKEESPDISPEKSQDNSPEKPDEDHPANKENEEEEKDDPSFKPSADLFGETEKRLNDTLKKGTAPIPKPKS